MWEGTARPESLPEVAVHKHLLAAEEARMAGHILHQELPCHGTGLDRGTAHHSQGRLPQPDPPRHLRVPGLAQSGIRA